MISELTNLFAEQNIANNPNSFCHPHSYFWTATTVKDIEKLLALHLLTRLIQKPSTCLY